MHGELPGNSTSRWTKFSVN